MARRDPKVHTVRTVLLRVRCSEDERAGWADKAHAEERSLSDYTRHVLSSEPMRPRTQPPEVDPTLLAAVGRMGSNLNQISHALNTDRKAGRVIDLIAVRTLLLAVTRQLAAIVEDHSR